MNKREEIKRIIRTCTDQDTYDSELDRMADRILALFPNEVEALKAEVVTLSKALRDCMPFVNNHLADKIFPLYNKHLGGPDLASHPDRYTRSCLAIRSERLEEIDKDIRELKAILKALEIDKIKYWPSPLNDGKSRPLA